MPRAQSTGRTERLRRLAAVGMLTRSYAHEFNNVLGGILGTAQLLSLRHEDPDLRARLATITASVQRGIALTASLAGVAQGGRAAGEPVDAHLLLRELLDEGALPATATLDRGAARPLMRADGEALRECLLVVAQLLAGEPAGRLTIATRNRATASARPAEDLGDALPWLEIAITGERAPSADERRLLEEPLSPAEGAEAILLAGAGAVVRQARGRLVVGDDQGAPRVLIFLPVV
jgi:hypothetical protein